jgi:hypothetical protein
MNDDSFYSMDRLVEFGMSMAIAQQMINTMNHAMTNMHVPGAMNTIPSAPHNEIFYVILNEKSSGPFSGKEILDLILQNQINKDSFAWKPGMTTWKKIEEVPEILKFVALTPPKLPGTV